MSATVSDRSASRSAVSAAFSNAAAAATCAPCVSRSRASLRIARTSAFTSPAAMAASRSRWWKYEAFSWSFFSRKNAASVARAAGTAVEGSSAASARTRTSRTYRAYSTGSSSGFT